MKPDEVNIDEVARLVLSQLKDDSESEGVADSELPASLEIVRNEVRGLVAALETDDSIAAPADLIRRTATLLRQRGLVSMIAAVLVYDSRRRSQTGFRSPAARCHMTFDAEGEKVDLHLKPTGDGCHVRGQVGEDRTSVTGVVHFLASDGFDSVADTPIDSYGYFDTVVPAGEYDLQISLPDCTILLQNVWIG